jgi:molecular chaperone GrpE (heat shock protein)
MIPIMILDFSPRFSSSSGTGVTARKQQQETYQNKIDIKKLLAVSNSLNRACRAATLQPSRRFSGFNAWLKHTDTCEKELGSTLGFANLTYFGFI